MHSLLYHNFICLILALLEFCWGTALLHARGCAAEIFLSIIQSYWILLITFRLGTARESDPTYHRKVIQRASSTQVSFPFQSSTSLTAPVVVIFGRYSAYAPRCFTA